MWTRKSTDPLGKLLFDKYGMHMLARPRENVSVLQVFGVRNGHTVQSGSIETLLRSGFDKPEIVTGEHVLDIEATRSDAISGQVGLTFLQGFLALVGAAATSLSAAVEKSKEQTLRFRFGGCTRDYVKDDFALDWAMTQTPFDGERSAMKDDHRYFIATGVHYCKQLTFEVLDNNLAKVDLSAQATAIGAAKGAVTISRDRGITAASDRSLAYGVELNEIVYDRKRKRLQVEAAKNFVHTRAAVAEKLPTAAQRASADEMMVLRVVE